MDVILINAEMIRNIVMDADDDEDEMEDDDIE